MSCQDREKRLPAYLEEDLSPAEMDDLTEHLASCEDCRKVLEDLMKTGCLVHDLEEVSPPPWLKSQIMGRVREEAAKKRGVLRKFFFPLYIKIPVQAFAVVVISVLAFYLYRQDAPQIRMKGIPLPSAPVFETTQEPASPPSRRIPRKQPFMSKGAAQGDHEMPAVITGQSDADDSSSSPVSGEEVLDTGKIAADDVMPETAHGSAAPVPPAMSQVLGGEAKGAFLSAMKQKNGETRASMAFPRERNGVCEPGEELCRYEAKPEEGDRSLAKDTRMPGMEMSLEWILSVPDAAAAVAELEDYAGKIDTRYTETAIRDGKHVFTTDIRPFLVGSFREKLRTLGQVSADKEPEVAKDTTWVHIKIILVPSAHNKP